MVGFCFNMNISRLRIENMGWIFGYFGGQDIFLV